METEEILVKRSKFDLVSKFI